MIYPDGEPGAVLTLIAEEEERRKGEQGAVVAATQTCAPERPVASNGSESS